MRIPATVALILLASSAWDINFTSFFRFIARQSQKQTPKPSQVPPPAAQEKPSQAPSSAAQNLPSHWNTQATEILGEQLTRDLDLEHRDLRAIMAFLHDEIRRRQPQLQDPMLNRIVMALVRSGDRYQLDPMLLLAMIIQESDIHPRAVGRHGEIGLMQLKPDTARWLLKKNGDLLKARNLRRQDLFRPEINVEIGAAYLSYLRSIQGTDRQRYISSYNSGPSPKAGYNSKYRRSVIQRYRRLIEAFANRPDRLDKDVFVTYRMKD